jgi:hypothetical protein
MILGSIFGMLVCVSLLIVVFGPRMAVQGIQPILGTPGITAGPTVTYGQICGRAYQASDLLPGGGRIANISQDWLNTTDTNTLRCGLLMGIATSSTYNQLYRPSVIDATQGALANGGTSVTLTAAGAAGLVATQGTSGTFTLTGGIAANQVARSITITYSAANTTTGVVTITSPTVNQVVTLGFTNSPSGTFQLTIQDYLGVLQRTAPITYSATVATLISNMQTAINAVIPQVASTNQIVVGGTAVTAITLTYSGVNYTGLTFPAIGVDVGGLSAGNVSNITTTAAVNGAFIAGSFVGPTDGSQVPVTVIADGSGILMGGIGGVNVDWSVILISQLLISANILPYAPTDTGLRNFIMSSLNNGPGNYGFQFTQNWSAAGQ